MANLRVTALALLMLAIITTSKAQPVLPSEFLESDTNSITDTVDLGVFSKGNLKTIINNTAHSSFPILPLYIVWPNKPGVYPVLLFFHGFALQNDYYSNIFEHVASHGFIVVAPQLYPAGIPVLPFEKEIERAVSVANWVGSDLNEVLPEGITGDMSRLAVSGHSRGGKTAFALALGKNKKPLEVKISALIGIDPVAGGGKDSRPKPHVLTYVPNSFNLPIPVTVIGTGLGNQSRIPFILPSCAPNEVNHAEFFNECKEGTYFVTKDYGHMDMLDDNKGQLQRGVCVGGQGSGDPMRRTLGGIMVAFLDAYFLNEPATFINILHDPSVAPAKLYPVQAKNSKVYQRDAHGYAQV